MFPGDEANLLAAGGLATVEDLLGYFPSHYIEPCGIFSLSNLELGKKICLIGKFKEPKIAYLGDKTYCTAEFIEETSGDSITCMFFSAKNSYRHYLLNLLRSLNLAVIEGKPSRYGRGARLIHPQITGVSCMEEAANFCFDAKKPHPIYKSIENLPPTKLKSLIFKLLKEANIKNVIPESLITMRGFPTRRRAFAALHNPERLEDIGSAKEAFKFEEALVSQCALKKLESGEEKFKSNPINPKEELDEALKNNLPFSLTPSQKKALEEIKVEMAKTLPMRKLLEGDVGTGKTIVALLAMLRCAGDGRQAVLVAPTMVLAWQHYKNFKKLLSLLGLSAPDLFFLSGDLKKVDRDRVRDAVQSGNPCLVVATHSAFYSFSRHNLGLVVIDEQHRFGVLQKGRFSKEGKQPHLLSMSATPIPRSIAMTFFSDMSISRLEPRKVQQKPQTILIDESENESMAKLFWHCRKEIERGRRVFAICPAVESCEMHSVEEIFSRLRGLPQFKGIEMASLTGKNSVEEKEKIISAFSSGTCPLLVSTSVVETGIDIPHASCMLIFDANRFGLSQLHQFRGRVGRDGTRAWTFLISRDGGEDSAERLEAMRRHSSGKEVSEFDMRNRGEGDVLGDEQAGKSSSFKFLSIMKDLPVLESAKKEAKDLDLRSFPALEEKCDEFLDKYRQFLMRF